MQKALFYKTLIVALMLLAIGIPLSMIGSLIGERQHRQAEAVQEIANSYAGAQRLTGPVLVLPYTEYFTVDETETDVDGKKSKRQVTRRVEHQLTILPASLQIGGQIDTNTKHRGLFKALIYAWQSKIDGSFQIPEKPDFERAHPNSTIYWGEAFLALGLGDTRGVSGTPQLNWNGRQITFERDSRIPALGTGLHAPLGTIEPGKAMTVPFHLDLSLRGTEQLSIAPLAGSNRIELASAWPHPSFGGRFLPDAQTQRIGPEGFRAVWNISALASNAGAQFLKAVDTPEKCALSCIETLDLRLVEPVNVYTQADRALKYGFLFVGLAFAAFFLFEIMKRLPIHPAQYFLVGLSMAMFFLVLSLSEHIAFGHAYLAAAGASVSLITYYLAHILRSLWRGLAFGAMLGLLFATLYGLLVSEDNALIMGSLLLFALLTVAMVATRKLDWYRLGASDERGPATVTA
ncbi:MAG TPA: cell envelope integrity protein CreD [Rhodocyclaceae bacterium]|nr:cell envelope integrity protein CreD [Rhodocyclaceae bacterium]